MESRKHELLIISAALVVLGALMLFRAFDSPQMNSAVATTVSFASSETAESVYSGKVNINTASLEELMTLTDIGEKRAKAIIEYRQKNGKFLLADDLANVEGIGSATVERNRFRITF